MYMYLPLHTCVDCIYICSVCVYLDIQCLFWQVSVEECTEGIVRVAQQTQSLDPRQQASLEWEMAAGLNADLSHNCTGTYVHRSCH